MFGQEITSDLPADLGVEREGEHLGISKGTSGMAEGKGSLLAPLYRDGSPRTSKTLLRYDNLFLVNLCTIASI